MTYEIPPDVLTKFPCYTPLKSPKGLSVELQLELFYKINLIREFDSSLKALYAAQKIYGLAHPYVGAEAIAVGACAALRPSDFITSTHRGHGHVIAKGGDVKKMMAELFGKYEGYNKGKGGSMHIADVEHGMLGATGIVGSAMPHAVGAAYAFDYLGKDGVAICFHGDGGTNQGVWHESVNMAAAWKLPVIFLTENNQMAIATNLEWVTCECELNKRAVAYGIPGVCVDGFNPFAVYEAVKTAVDRARSGKGPTLVEAKIFRFLGHTAVDDQTYRDVKAVEPLWVLEPIRRLRHYFLENEIAAKEKLDSIENKARKEIAEAIQYASEHCTEPPAETVYDDLYAHGEKIY
jgi:pyruvate dehydrogenase E1 component alpha subunit